MDLLNSSVRRQLFNPKRPIYTKTRDDMPTKYGTKADVKNSLIADGCIINGTVKNSILFRGVKVEKGAVVEDSVIMPGAKIKAGAVVQYAIIAENAVVEENATVGKRPEDCADKDKWGVATIGPEYRVPANTVVEPQEMLGV